MNGTIEKDTQSGKRTVRRALTALAVAAATSLAIVEPAVARIALNHNESAARDRG